MLNKFILIINYFFNDIKINNYFFINIKFGRKTYKYFKLKMVIRFKLYRIIKFNNKTI